MISAFIVRSSDPTALLVWCGVGFCAGIGLFIYGFKLLQRRRLILDTPFSKIRSAAMGMVEVSGLAVGPYTMIAPITARPCYYYRTLVWEYKQQGKNKQWVKVAGECMHVPFFVDDNTGRMLVDPRGADLDLHCDFEEQFCDSFFTVKESAPDNVRNFLGRHGVVTNNKIKVQEYCIKPKNSLFLLGTLSENPGLEVGPEPVREDALRSTNAMSFSLGSISMGSMFSLSSRSQGDDSSVASELVLVGTARRDDSSPVDPTNSRKRCQASRGNEPTTKDRRRTAESGNLESRRLGCGRSLGTNRRSDANHRRPCNGREWSGSSKRRFRSASSSRADERK